MPLVQSRTFIWIIICTVNELPFSHFSYFIQYNAAGPISSMEIAQLNIILSGVTVQGLVTIFGVRIHNVSGSSNRFEIWVFVVCKHFVWIILILRIFIFYYVTKCSRSTMFRWYLLEFECIVNVRLICYQSNMFVNSSSWPRSHWTTCVYLWASTVACVCRPVRVNAVY